jgi:catechol 2,3-dioxygenase-like lactoylglutathione lyase family enzyme
MERSLEFYCDLVGLELVWRGELPAAVIGRIVGVPEATGFDVAFLRIPGSETQVELLEYRGIEQESGAGSPARHGTARATSVSSSGTSTPFTRISPRRASAFARTGRSR